MLEGFKGRVRISSTSLDLDDPVGTSRRGGGLLPSKRSHLQVLTSSSLTASRCHSPRLYTILPTPAMVSSNPRTTRVAHPSESTLDTVRVNSRPSSSLRCGREPERGEFAPRQRVCIEGYPLITRFQ